MSYAPIGSYGIIGNLHTSAHVGMHGSIDWLCLPHFDSPSVFAALLDDHKGGCFSIRPDADDQATNRQFYWPDTNILVTRFQGPSGVAETVDFMPLRPKRDGRATPHVIRMVHGIWGKVGMHMSCQPAFDYARAEHALELREHAARFRAPCGVLDLSSTVPIRADGSVVRADFELEAGQTIVFALHYDPPQAECSELDPGEARRLFEETLAYWRRWVSRCSYQGRWREMVRRSALALKLLTFEPTGAIVAAPTCSLPAPIGGVRNWDYRYTWIRDAAFTLYGLMRVGFTDEAVAFMHWIEARIADLKGEGMLQPLYRLDGSRDVEERTLDHLDGYMGSRPVRIGNAAHKQLQTDVAGELIDSVYLHNKYAEPLAYDTWTHVTHLLEWVCDNWMRADKGVWEVRGPDQHFVYSKLMCWVALDRGIRLADKRSFPADRRRWLETRDAIYREIMDRGYHDSCEAFVQHYDSDALDAANLMMPLVFFVAPSDPRMLSTIERIASPLTAGGLMADTQLFRYRQDGTDDGLEGEEGGFNICTFWLIEAMTRAGRGRPEYLEKARLLFEKVLGYANHLGLYAEQTGIRGEALGNFPQAFTHLSFISAAFNLDRALGGTGK